MVKQWLIVALAGLTFLLVWGLVILQFINIQPALHAREVASIQRSYYKKDLQEKNVIEHTIEASTQTENVNEVSEKIIVTDLRKIDFSDVITDDGVPIDAVLERLQLLN